jgi:hypothetical protein
LPEYARINPVLSPIPPPTVDAVSAYLSGTPDPELDHDPATDYQQIHCPVFLQYGANDVNVPVPESENRIRGALESAGNRDVTISTYPDAGHMLGVSPSTTGNSARRPVRGGVGIPHAALHVHSGSPRRTSIMDAEALRCGTKLHVYATRQQQAAGTDPCNISASVPQHCGAASGSSP